jgi:hypothetical protein
MREPNGMPRSVWLWTKICLWLTAAVCAVGCDHDTSPRMSLVIARDVADSEAWPMGSDLAIADCPVREDLAPIVYRNPLGADAEVWTDPTSRLEVDFNPESLLLTRHPEDEDIVFVRARFSEADQRRLAEYRQRYAACRVMIALDDRAVWIATNRTDWSEEIPIGAFDSGTEVYAAVTGGEWALRWTEWPELEAAGQATRASEARALERLRCDSAFRTAFEKENPGAIDLLSERLSHIDCSSGETP